MIPHLLNHPDPGRLVASSSPEEVVDALRQLGAEDPWPDWSLRLLDRLFIVWSAAAIARHSDEQGIAELQSALAYACTRARNAATLPESWRARWQAASDMLESRRQGLQGRDPDLILGRKHVQTLLGMLGAQETAQSDLAAALSGQGVDITPGRLSQLLSLMESHGLLEKRKDGRENRLKLSEQGAKYAPAPAAAAPAPHPDGFRASEQAAQYAAKPAASPAEAHGRGFWTNVEVVQEHRPWLEAEAA
ncbi:MAG: helix-turn-helix transcriptional regulator [Rhodocyclaceae bacterium]|nr:helix-turn-helix transcriptional regulator [Rhodocyclaceae bacterium]